MNDDSQRQIVKAYFDGLAAKDMSRVPWAKDATLRTPLNPEGGEGALIRGRKAILEFFIGILPAVRNLKFWHYYTGDDGWVAGRPRSLSQTARRSMLSMHVANGEIVEQQNHYDPRPATAKSHWLCRRLPPSTTVCPPH